MKSKKIYSFTSRKMNTGMQISAYMNTLEQHVQSCAQQWGGRIVRCRFIDVLISKPRGEGNTLHSLNRID